MLYASNVNYVISDKHSFVLPKNSLEVQMSYLKVNDALDIFHLKEKQFNNLGSIGDMDGYHLALRYGVTNKDSIFVSTQRWNIDYIDSTLKNNKYTAFNRYELIDAPKAFLNSLSFDIGFEQNSATPIKVANDRFLNALLKKMKPNSKIKVDNGNILLDDTSITFYDKKGNKIYPYIALNNLKSNSYFTRVLIGKEFSKKSLLDFYLGFKYTTITTGTSFYPNNSLTNSMLKNHTMPNLNRDEKDVQVGFSYFLQVWRVIGEFNYEFNKMFRDSDVSYLDKSHTVDASLALKVTKNSLVYVGGKLMLEQFNSAIPYLYNRYTKTQFDHRYGFAKFGFIYKFK